MDCIRQIWDIDAGHGKSTVGFPIAGRKIDVGGTTASDIRNSVGIAIRKGGI